jgi:uncharacterized phage-associated protein
MPRPYHPLAFANEFILKAQPAGVEHMKLQKLVYYSYGWWIAYHEEPILTEPPQVWRYGPVFVSLYRTLKHHGRSPITEPQVGLPFEPPPRVDRDDSDGNQLVRWVWDRYGHYTSYELSDMTHAPGSPWRQVAAQHDWRVSLNTPIPDHLIRADIKAAAKEFGLM